MVSKRSLKSRKGFPKRLQQHKATTKHRRKQNLQLKRSLWEIYDYAFSTQLGQKLNFCLKSSTDEAATIPQPPSLITNPQHPQPRSKHHLLLASHSASGGGPGVLQRLSCCPQPAQSPVEQTTDLSRHYQCSQQFSSRIMAPFPSTPL